MSGFHNYTLPADWQYVKTSRYCGMFLVGDTLTFSFMQADYATPQTTANAYVVRNYYGQTVASGAVSGSSLTLSTLPPGWYKLYLTAARSDANYGTACGDFHFCVMRTNAALLAPPNTWGVSPGTQQADPIVRGVAVSGPFRYDIGNAGNLTDNSANKGLTGVQAGIATEKTYYSNANLDTARPRPLHVAFPNNSNPITAGELSGITTLVSTVYDTAGGPTYFEGPWNEPSGGAAASAVATQMQAFYNAVKAGNASAKVLGPAIISINNEAGSLPWLQSFLAAGGGSYVDGLSMHLYNCNNGDLSLARSVWTALAAALSAAGFSKPLWVSEWGTFAADNGVFEPRRQTQWEMMTYLVAEQHGVPKERFNHFYDLSHGFWNYSSFWEFNQNSVVPIIPMLRVFSEEVFGKTFTSAYTLGAPWDDIHLGSLYTAASGDKVAVFMSSGMTDGHVSLRLSGATSVTTVDCFGNTGTLTATGSVITVPVGMEPVYVRLPNGVTATLVQDSPGASFATITGKAATAPGTQAGTKLVDGTLRNSYSVSSASITHSLFPWNDTTATLPCTVPVTFPNALRVDRVVVRFACPWQSQAAPLAFTVETLDANGTTWTQRGSFTESVTSVASVSSKNGANCLADTYWSNRWIFDTGRFASPVTTKGVRVVVTANSTGGNPDATTIAAGGQGGGDARVTIQQIYAYCQDTAEPRFAMA